LTAGTTSPSDTPTPTSGPASSSASTPARHSASSPTSEPLTSSNSSTSPQFSVRISLFFLSFSIQNLQFDSSLEDPSTSYYQGLQRNISELLLQIYEQQGFLGLSNIKFSRPGSVLVESALAFRKGSVDACGVKTQFEERGRDLLDRYDLSISGVTVQDVSFPSSGQSGSGVPGWAVALLVLVCVLVALTVCQCRRKNCGQLDIFPTRNAYHPMSEYPTYHTHGRYVPPGSGRRSPYEEVSAGNGGSGLSYVNPNPSATSANL
uniref:Mucin-1 n=1 Tax=Ursus maritimus TaxID=29073 RepID=A0A452V0K7_URSMA